MPVISTPLKKQDWKTSQAEEIVSFLRKCWILYEEYFSFPVLWQKYLQRKKRVFFLFGQGPKSGFLQHDFIRYIIHCSAGEKQHMAEQYNLILTKDFLYLL